MKPSEIQLRKDLQKRTRERLYQVVHDIQELYEMAGLDVNEGLVDCYCHLVSMVISGAIAIGLNADDLLKEIREGIELGRKEIKDAIHPRN